jgi:hypothetical protein
MTAGSEHDASKNSLVLRSLGEFSQPRAHLVRREFGVDPRDNVRVDIYDGQTPFTFDP